MSTELFVIEDDNGEMLDSDDDGGFSVFYTQEDAQRVIEDVGDDLKLTIVRFERSDKLSSLEAENARLLEDKERLDWLEKTANDYCQSMFGESSHFVVSDDGDVLSGVTEDYPHKDLRAAIDAARGRQG